jgi:hypothetical protein
MKTIIFAQAVRSCGKLIFATLVLSAAITILSHDAEAVSIDLGTAGNFAVLASSTVVNTGPTIISGGDVGLSPGTAVVGFPPGTVAPPYTIHAGDAAAQQGQSDLTVAYNAAAGLASTATLTGQDLGGLTLTPGVYFFASSAQLTGPLTLNYEGNPDALFVFQIGSTLTTASASSVLSINGGLTPGCNVFWQVGSSATLGTTTDFTGHIMALASITLNTGATLDGSALARNGAVTLDANTITTEACSVSVPDAGSTLALLGFAILSIGAVRRRVA